MMMSNNKKFATQNQSIENKKGRSNGPPLVYKEVLRRPVEHLNIPSPVLLPSSCCRPRH